MEYFTTLFTCSPVSSRTTDTSVTFKVARKSPELIAPAKPTPHEFKPVSDIDDQEGLRLLALGIHFFRRIPSMEGKDPAKVIRDAIAKALVHYYPLAGRLRERAARKLEVECTGEGVMFVEADADVALHQFGDPLHPPFPCVGELLYDVPASTGVLHSPLVFIQVTRLKCGGFIFAIHINHTMCDAAGHAQFISAVGELARGADAPSISPFWDRHLLHARDPPRVTFTHPEYDSCSDAQETPSDPLHDTVQRSFFFGAASFAALRSHMPPHLRNCSRFELLAACLWRCRTIAISPGPNEEVRMMVLVNCRRRFSPPLPVGYYGNVFAYPVAIATAGDLSRNPLVYAVELVRKAKAVVTEEYMRSTADMLVMRGRPRVAMVRSYGVSDVTYAGFEQIDFGWGKSVYNGHTEGCTAAMSFLIPFKNNKGENGIMVPMRLPSNAMEVFTEELERMLKVAGDQVVPSKTTVFKALASNM